ncbi:MULTISPECIES: hypothetical protein [Bacillus cereus group]|nr:MULTISPECIES: hypothetical protein [Bacillus cereus group]
MIDTWNPLQMKLSNEGEPTDLLSAMPPIFTKKAVDVVFDLMEGKGPNL